MTDLRELSLNNNKLIKIDSGFFSYNRELSVLDLSGNQINELNFDFFAPSLRKMIYLFLDDNNLKELTNYQNDIFPYIQTFGIANNRFNCTYLDNFLRTLKPVFGPYDMINLRRDSITSQDYINLLNRLDSTSSKMNLDGMKNIDGVDCEDIQTI